MNNTISAAKTMKQFIILIFDNKNPARTVHYFWNVAEEFIGIDEKLNPLKI